MLDALKPYLSEIVSFIAGFAGGSLITLTVSRNKVRGSGSLVDQSGSRVKGDMVGGNKSTRK